MKAYRWDIHLDYDDDPTMMFSYYSVSIPTREIVAARIAAELAAIKWVDLHDSFILDYYKRLKAVDLSEYNFQGFPSDDTAVKLAGCRTGAGYIRIEQIEVEP